MCLFLNAQDNLHSPYIVTYIDIFSRLTVWYWVTNWYVLFVAYDFFCSQDFVPTCSFVFVFDFFLSGGETSCAFPVPGKHGVNLALDQFMNKLIWLHGYNLSDISRKQPKSKLPVPLVLLPLSQSSLFLRCRSWIVDRTELHNPVLNQL